MRAHSLTQAQGQMLQIIETSSVYLTPDGVRNHDYWMIDYWMIDDRRASRSEANLIGRLQRDKLVSCVRVSERTELEVNK
jgi:hypothetical protein